MGSSPMRVTTQANLKRGYYFGNILFFIYTHFYMIIVKQILQNKAFAVDAFSFLPFYPFTLLPFYFFTFLPFPLKEFLHNGATLFFEDTGGDGSFRMKGIRGITQKATLFVRRTKYHTRYLAPA